MDQNLKKGNLSMSIVLIVAAIIIFVGGMFAGVMYGSQNSSGGQTSNSSDSATKLANDLKSKTVSSIVIFGKVQNISGRTLSILNNGDTIKIAIAQNAKFSSIDYSAKNPVQQNANFGNVKVGSSVNISAKVLANNSLQGVSVVIFPVQK